MEFENEIRQFIEEHIDLIDENCNYHELYSLFRNALPTRCWGSLTMLFDQAGINVLPYCGAITPRFFAFNCSYSIDRIPSNIRVISERSFEKNSGLTNLILPAGLGQIQNYAFMECKNLKQIYIPDSLEELGDAVFEKTGLTSIDLTNTRISKIPYRTFSFTLSLQDCKLPRLTTEIGEEAFCASHIPSLYIPASVIKIGNRAFTGAKQLKEIFYEGTLDQWNNIKKYETWCLESTLEVIHCKDGDNKHKANRFLF